MSMQAEQAAEVEQLAREIVAGCYGSERDVDVVDGAVAAGLDTVLWSALERAGLTLLTVPEDQGGSGGTLADAAAVLMAAAERAAAVPLAETDILGAWLLGCAGLAAPSGPTTVAVADAFGERDTVDLLQVPWASGSAHLVVAFPTPEAERVTVVEEFTVRRRGANLAGEPRDEVAISREALLASARPVPAGTIDAVRYRGALARALALAGAARSALDQTLGHVSTREQFGRPLSRLQAVQHLLAEMAAEAAMMRAAASAAVTVVDRAGMDSPHARLAIGAAKLDCSRSAGVVARIAHQLHGAIGTTQESSLRLATTRLWAWREEWGNERVWATSVGEQVLTSTHDVWELVTA
jgi:acyl-CoA dehydrogenase